MKRHFANTFEFDPAKDLIIPYADILHRKTGVIQVIGPAAAAGAARRIARARATGAPGLPIYAGHPDVPELAPRYPNKAALGWITACTPHADHMALTPAWVDQPPPAGAYIYFSPWLLGDSSSPERSLIDDIQSIGLTNSPNDTRFRLPNEADTTTNNPTSPADTPGEPEEHQMKRVLTLLNLPDTATEEEAATAVQALIDDKNALARKIEEQTAQATANETALEEQKKDFANERAARCSLLLDCALSEGRITPATRPVWEKRLQRDFPNEAEALGRETAAIKTRTSLPNEAPATEPAGILARYEAMPAGPEKDAFLSANAIAINDARVALSK